LVEFSLPRSGRIQKDRIGEILTAPRRSKLFGSPVDLAERDGCYTLSVNELLFARSF